MQKYKTTKHCCTILKGQSIEIAISVSLYKYVSCFISQQGTHFRVLFFTFKGIFSYVDLMKRFKKFPTKFSLFNFFKIHKNN